MPTVVTPSGMTTPVSDVLLATALVAIAVTVPLKTTVPAPSAKSCEATPVAPVK